MKVTQLFWYRHLPARPAGGASFLRSWGLTFMRACSPKHERYLAARFFLVCLVGWLCFSPVTSRVSPRRASYFLLALLKESKQRTGFGVFVGLAVLCSGDKPGFGPAAELLFFASPKKSNQKKGEPRPCRFAVPCATRSVRDTCKLASLRQCKCLDPNAAPLLSTS